MKKKIKNKDFWSAYNRNMYIAIISAIILIVSGIFTIHYFKKNQELNNNAVNFFDIDIYDKNNTEKYVYIELNHKPVQISFNKENSYHAYLFNVNNKNYLSYLGDETANNTSNTKDNCLRIYGYATEVDNEIIESGLQFLSQQWRRNNLSETDFYNYFGYLHFEAREYNKYDTIVGLFIFADITAFGFIIYGLQYNVRFKKNIKKISQNKLQELNSEINSKDAIYFCDIILCKDYLLDTKRFILNSYDDIEAISVNKTQLPLNKIFLPLALPISFEVRIKTIHDKKMKMIGDAAHFQKSSKKSVQFIEYIKKNHASINCNYNFDKDTYR